MISADSAGGQVFKGTRYATPPISELRQHEPYKNRGHSGKIFGFEFGAICPQSLYLKIFDLAQNDV